jgi:restriction endonuclease S subunit
MGQDLLRTITSGNTIPMITLRDLLRLEIPVPSLESAQHAAVLLDEEQALQDQIEELQRKLAQLAGNDWTLGMLD